MTAIRSINALTLATKDMVASCSFYSKLGLHLTYGGCVHDYASYVYPVHAPLLSIPVKRVV